MTGKLSTCITDDLLCVRSHKTGSTHTGHVVTGRIARLASYFIIAMLGSCRYTLVP